MAFQLQPRLHTQRRNAITRARLTRSCYNYCCECNSESRERERFSLEYNFQFALEPMSAHQTYWTCAHSRTWMSFAFCYTKRTHRRTMRIMCLRFCSRDGLRTNQHLIELFGVLPPRPNRSNRTRIIARWRRFNLKCNLLRATNERRRPVCILPTRQKPQHIDAHASIGMRNLGC